MKKIQLKRVYEDPESSDGYRVFVDKLWPRGMSKSSFLFDLWAKEITPSTGLRKWFHLDPDNHWEEFGVLYKQELENSSAIDTFLRAIETYPVVTLLFASKSANHNHAIILKEFLEKRCNS